MGNKDIVGMVAVICWKELLLDLLTGPAVGALPVSEVYGETSSVAGSISTRCPNPQPRAIRDYRRARLLRPTAYHSLERRLLNDFPAEHWKHIRTTIESTFATVRLRTVKTKGCLSRKTALAMAFKLILSARRKWRKLEDQINSPNSSKECRSRTNNQTRRLISPGMRMYTPW